jgi:hypothetical protein
MTRTKKLILLVPLGIVAVAVFITVGGVVVQWLWNWLVPSLFGWREVTFWQAVGLLALCRILFGGIGRHGGHRSWDGPRVAGRWGRMTAEERERFRQRMREMWGFSASTSEPGPPGRSDA